jgi:hypothetical protein
MKHILLTRRISLSLSLSILAVLGWNLPVSADSGATLIGQVINPGLLTITPAAHTDLSAVTLSHALGQTSSASLGPILIDDSRGSAAGWSLSATISNLDGTTNANPFTITGTYTGNTDADYTLITGTTSNGDHLGKTPYSLSGPSLNTTGTLIASQSIGSTGLTINAADISYPAFNSYYLHVHVIPASTISFNPGAFISSNSLLNVTPGSKHTFTGINDPATILNALKGYGDGYYQASATLSIAIPAGTHAGSYTGTLVETVN